MWTPRSTGVIYRLSEALWTCRIADRCVTRKAYKTNIRLRCVDRASLGHYHVGMTLAPVGS